MRHPLPDNQQCASARMFAPRHCLAVGFAFYLLMILVGSLPAEAAAVSATAPHKLLHFCAYALITMLLYRGLGGTPTTRATLALALGAFLGGVDEALQMLFPYLTADWSDWHFDVAAVLCAVGLSLAVTALTAMRLQRRTSSISDLPVAVHQRQD